MAECKGYERKPVGVAIDPHRYSKLSLFVMVNATSRRSILTEQANRFVDELDIPKLTNRLISIKQEEWEKLKHLKGFDLRVEAVEFSKFKKDVKLELQTNLLGADVINIILKKLAR